MMGTPTVLVGIPPVTVMPVTEILMIVLMSLPNVVALGVPTTLPTTSDVVVTLPAMAAALKPDAI